MSLPFKPTLKLDFETPEELANPYIIAQVLNEYKAFLLEGRYRFLVIGKISEEVYLDKTLDLFYNINKKDNNSLSSSQFFQMNKFSLGFENSVDSVFNINEEPKMLIITKQLQIDPYFFKQRFLDGVGHCFFDPILAYIKDKRAYAKVKMANNELGREMQELIKDGIIRNVSFGYKINAMDEDRSTDPVTYRASSTMETLKRPLPCKPTPLR